MKALILAAGLGTRLGPLTLGMPKSMLLLAGTPLIEHLVDWLKHHGIADIAINLHYHPDAIIGSLEDGSRLGVRLTYSHEPTLLGTAGAARKLKGFLDEPFVVVYGDGFTNLDLARVLRLHEDRRRAADPHITVVLRHVPNPTECGLADLNEDRRVTRFVEKPAPEEVFTDLASAGILILDHELLALIPDGEVTDFGRDFLPLALSQGVRIYGEPLQDDEFLIDIGTPASYERACEIAVRTSSVLSR